MVSFSKLKELYPDNWLLISRKIKDKRNNTCEDCGKKYPANSKWLNAHHIVPLSKGGDSEDDNLQVLCYKCHKKRHPHMGGASTVSSSRKPYSKPFA